MKKFYIFLSVFFVAFIISSFMYPLNKIKNYYNVLGLEEPGDEWDEILLKTMTGTGNPKTFNSTTVFLFKPIRVFENASSLKINIYLDEKVNIKIKDATGAPVYLRQFTPDVSNEILINTINWSKGFYTIVFTNTDGEEIAIGDLIIR